MRKTTEQLIQEAKEAQAIRQNREDFAARITEADADRLGKAVHGSYFTNPELTASLGLSGLDMDFQQIHQLNAKKLREQFKYSPPKKLTPADPVKPGKEETSPFKPDFSKIAENYRAAIKDAGISEYGLPDLFAHQKLMGNVFLSKLPFYEKEPDWFNEVDPEGVWRSLEIPEKINDAKELLDLSEAQVIKHFLYGGWGEWNKIPNIYDGIPLGEKDAKANPNGVFETLRKKFPALKQMWDVYLQQEAENNNLLQTVTGMQFGGNLNKIKSVLKAPISFASWLAPDTIKIPGAASSIGPIPISLDLEGAANIVRGGLRATMTGFVGAAQLSKNLIEWRMTTPSVGGPYISTDLPVYNEETLDNFQKLVIQGNVITQIANQALKDPSQIDLGSGFFPEGEIMRRAIEAHDAGLPKLSQGQTWTFGQQIVDPFIAEGYIDPDGWIANVISGIADAAFTVGTDIGVYVDPIQAIIKKFNLAPSAASKVITNGRQADIIREQWANARKSIGAPTVIKEPLEMVFDSVTNSWKYVDNVEADQIPKFAGILPPGSELPEEAEKIAQELAQKAVEGKNLAALDAPPLPLPYQPPSTSLQGFKQNLGVIDDGSGVLRINPMAIDNMPNYADGRRALNKLASFNNVGELWDAFVGNIPIGVAVQIQDYVDAAKAAGLVPDIKEVHKILVDGVLKADPLYSVRTTPGVLKQAVNQTGKSIARWGAGFTRQFATMPGSTFFSFNDPLSSIKDMNNLMVIMKVPKATRHKMLSETMNAVVKEGPKARFELANKWMDAVVGTQLRKNGVPEEWVKVVTSWSGWDDGIHRWTMDAIGQGYYLPWLEDGTGEILRSVDFMNHGFLMVAPEHLRQVINETTNLWRVLKPLRGNPKVEAILNQKITQRLEKVQKGFLKPIALGAPLPIRMITKVFMLDDVARTAISGEFGFNSLMAMTAFGHVNYTTHGVIIRSAKEISKRAAILEEFSDLQALLRDARAMKLLDREQELLEQISKLEKKYGSASQIKKEIAEFNRRIETELPGANRKLSENIRGIGSMEREDPRFLRYERSKITETAFRDSEPNKWVIGTSRDLVRMHQSEEYRIVAKVLLDGDPQAIADLPRRFRSGDLRGAFDKYRKGLANENPLMPLDSDAGINAWVGTIVADISTRTVMDPILLGAVVSGRIGNVSIVKDSISHLWDATKELKAYVRRTHVNNPNAPIAAPFYRTVASAEEIEKERKLLKGFIMYRNLSQKYARGPLHEQKKWRHIIELMPVMDPQEAQKMAAALEKSDAPEFLVDEIRRNVKYAEGTATRKQVEMLGDVYAFEESENILYNFDKQSYFGSKHALLFGFFDAFKEQWSYWLRKIATEPSILEKGRLVQSGLTNMELPSWAGGEPGRGIMFKDEDTGQQVIALPFTKQIYSMLGLNAEERISTKNLSLLGQPVPGFFGIGGMIINSIMPDNQLFNGIRSAFFPYGKPVPLTDVADYISAPWLRGLIVSSTGLINRTEIGQQIRIPQLLESFFTTEMTETLRATTLNAVLTNIAANANGLPVTGEQRVKLIEDAQRKSDSLLIIKSLIRIFSPAAPMTKYFVDTKQENVSTGAVSDDLRKFIEESETYSEAVTKFLEKYGDSAWIFLSGATKSFPGMQPTKEYAKWFSENESIVKKFPEVGAYLGPQTGEFNPGAYSEQRSAGYRTPKDITERQNDALNSVAWAIYNNKKQQLVGIGASQGYTYEQVVNSSGYKNEMKKQSDEIKKQFPLWDPSGSFGETTGTLVVQLDEIDRMVKDKKVLSTTTGKSLEEYWTYRKRNIKKAISSDPSLINDAWRTSRTSGQALNLRRSLTQMGDYLVQQDPNFSIIWEKILSREFDPPEAG